MKIMLVAAAALAAISAPALAEPPHHDQSHGAGYGVSGGYYGGYGQPDGNSGYYSGNHASGGYYGAQPYGYGVTPRHAARDARRERKHARHDARDGRLYGPYGH